MNQTSLAPKLVRGQDGLAVGEVGNICVVVWRGAVTRDRFDVQSEALLQATRRNPGGVGFLCVIESTASPPNDELRRASAEMIARHQADLRCIACVVEGSGFRNAVSRSALSAIAFIIGTRKAPLSVFDTVRAAATWMAPHVDVRYASGITAAVETIRAAVLPPSPTG